MKTFARFKRTLAALAAALTAIAVLAAPPGSAQPPNRPGGGGGSGGTSVQIVDRSLLVTAGFSSSLRVTGRPGPNRGTAIYCGWFRLAFGGYPAVQVVQVRRPVVGSTYLLYCWYRAGDRLVSGYPLVRVYRGPSLPGSPTSTSEVSRFAVSRIDFDHPSFVLSPDGAQITGVPTWLGVGSRLDYAGVSAAAGPVWAAVRPVFRDVVFELPDGSVLVCGRSSATTFWDANGPPGQANDCSHAFASAGTSEVAATLRWTIWQRTNRNRREHFWGIYTARTTLTVDVGELQAVIN